MSTVPHDPSHAANAGHPATVISSSCHDGALASEKLASLRERRNKADYDLDCNDVRRSSHVAATVRSSHDVVDSIQRCRIAPAFPEVSNRIRVYARDVLRLSVQEPSEQ